MNLEYSYYTDASHNYLAVRCPEEEGSRNYQIRMLTRNRIEGLLPCTRLSVGEDEDLYYDITSRQSLKNLYDNRTMTGAELKHFLEEMLAMEREIADYLLDCAKVVRSPELVFYDLFRDRYYFLYYPASCESSCHELFAFLSDHLDESDREAVYAAYRLTECSENPNFVLTEELVRELFPDPDVQEFGQNPEWAHRPADAGDIQDEQDAAMVRETETPYVASAAMRSWDLKEDSADPEQAGEEKNKKTGSNTLWIVSAFLCLLAGGGLEWVRRTQAVPQERLFPMLIAEMVLLLAAIALSAAAIIAGLRKPKADPQEEKLQEEASSGIREPEQPADSDSADHGRRAEDYLSETSWIRRNQSAGQQKSGRGPVRHSFLYDEQARYGAADGYEERLRPEDAPSKLHGLGNARMYHIDLSRLPCTVGRMSRFSDYTVEDTSVSGMHVRFGGTPEQITVEDLNSANGTYLNGERLRPGETQTLCRGDELRIGRLEFCYR